MDEYEFTAPFVVGEKIKFIGCSREQIQWGSNDDPTDILMIGETYKVSKVEIHSQHTKVSLEGFGGKFNSVCFDSL